MNPHPTERMTETMSIGFGNGPIWTPNYMCRDEERACWLQKVSCLDQQVQCLEQAAFFGRVAKQCDTCLQPCVGSGSGSDVRGAEIRGAEAEPALRVPQAEQQEVPVLVQMQVQVPMVQNVQKLVKVPQVEYVDQIVHETVQKHETAGTESEPELIPDKKFQASQRSGGRYWKQELEDPEESLEEGDVNGAAETLPPRPCVDAREGSVSASPGMDKKAKEPIKSAKPRAATVVAQRNVKEDVVPSQTPSPTPSPASQLSSSIPSPTKETPSVKAASAVTDAEPTAERTQVASSGSAPAARVSSSEACKKETLGEMLYPAIAEMHPQLAGKITGMMLTMDNKEILIILNSRQKLKAKVDEAMRVLQPQPSRASARAALVAHTETCICQNQTCAEDNICRCP